MENHRNKKLNRKIWRMIFEELKDFKKHFWILGIFAGLTAAVDVSLSYMTKYAIDNFIAKGDVSKLPLFAGVYFVLILLLGISIFNFIKNAGWIEGGFAYKIRKICFEKLQNLSMAYFDQNATGTIMARMTSDVGKLTDFVSWSLVDMVWGFTMMLGILGVMLAVDVKLSLITLAITPALIFVSFYFQKKIVILQRTVRKLNGKITAAINEGIMGAKTTKSLVIEGVRMNEFKAESEEMKSYAVKAARLSSLFQPVVINLSAIGMALALYYGGKGVLNQTVAYGTVVLFVNFSVQFFEPVREFARILSEMQSAQAAAERIYDLIHEKSQVEDNPQVLCRYGTILKPNKEGFEALEGHIRFEKVGFFYKPEEVVLRNIDLDIPAGTSVALVGETGSGKSTIVNLICRFYEATSGRIRIDGKDIRDRSQSWLHQNIGYVLQTPHLFSGTIGENIRYGRLSATDEEIQEAARCVGAHGFIMNFPKGYETHVGEEGSLLSKGQRQLVSFARAIIANPRIFVLDEATSAVDTETEANIQRGLSALMQGRTSFIVAHRLSTIKSCDRILVIHQGEVTEDGNHAALMAQKGRYYRLYTHQFKEEAEEKLLS